MILIPGVIAFLVGLRMPRRRALAVAIAVWAVIAAAVLVFDMSDGDGSFVVPAIVALALAVGLAWLGGVVQRRRVPEVAR